MNENSRGPSIDSLLLPDDMPSLRTSAMQTIFRAFESATEGTLIVDRECRIVWISERHARRFGFDDAIALRGLRVEDVIPASRMREVLKSGQPLLLDILEAPGKPLVCVRLPLKSNGETIGAIGFALCDEWSSLSPLVSRYLKMQQELAAARHAGPLRPVRHNFSDFVGVSTQTHELKRTARRAAATQSPVLLIGETGTGKELLAHAIHSASPRANKPFVTIGMGTMSDELIDIELFGTGPGASIGARRGKLSAANGGTLFLDDIAAMPLTVQAKLLQVLRTGEYESSGAFDSLDPDAVSIDVRIIAATEHDLPTLVKGRHFRADLYYRLDVLSIHLPPLRDHLADLESICEAVLENLSESRPGHAHELLPDAMALLARQRWPGNVRELRNVLERSILLSDTAVLTASVVHAALNASPGDADEVALPIPGASTDDDFRQRPAPALPANPPALSQPETQALQHAEAMHRYERQLIARALAETSSVSAAANRLGIGRATLYRKMAALGLARSDSGDT